MATNPVGRPGKFDSEFFSAQVVGIIKEIIPPSPECTGERAIIRLTQRMGVDKVESHIDIVVPMTMVEVLSLEVEEKKS